MLTVHTWEVVSSSIPLANTGAGALIAATLDTLAWIQTGFTVALSGPWVYYAVLVVAACAVGGAVFALLQTASGVAANAKEIAGEARLSGRSIRRAFGETWGGRLAVRSIAAAGMVVWWYGVSAVVPYAFRVWDGALAAGFTWQGCLWAGVTAAGMCLLWHVWVVLARLFALRPRVFGGTYQILSVL